VKRLVALVGLVVGVVVMPATAASAHPLGNFTVNTYSGLLVGRDRTIVDFVVDMAEIPTFQAKQEFDPNGDGRTDESESRAYRSRQCTQLTRKLQLHFDDRMLRLGLVASSLSFPPGQAGLSTLRLQCTFVGLTGTFEGEHRVTYRNANFADRVGWKEITAAGDGVTLVSHDVPAQTLSARLTRYPQNLLSSPLDRRTAVVRLRPGGSAARDATISGSRAPATPLPRGVDQATQAFTSFVGRHNLSVTVGMLAVLLSVLLGAIHALAPGHGKTVMAAYLVGQRGSLRHAALIGVTVTATHTAGVLALGVAIAASTIVAPERLYPWLGLASGVMLAVIGLALLMRFLRLRRRGAEAHRHNHQHDGHDVPGVATHSHGGRAHSHAPLGGDQPLSWSGLLAIGFVGGFLPSPSAVVVLLGAIALGRTWFGVLLVIAYGLGMAGTLMGAGLLLVRARGALDRRATNALRSPRLETFNRLLPAATGVVIVVVGLFLAARGAVQI